MHTKKIDEIQLRIRWLEIANYVKTWLWDHYFNDSNVLANFDIVFSNNKKAHSVKTWNNTPYGMPYKVVMKKERSKIYIDENLFCESAFDLGNKTSGVICIIIRSICEYVARTCSEDWKMKKVYADILPLNSQQLKYANAALYRKNVYKETFDKKRKTTKKKPCAKKTCHGWFSLWNQLVISVCGSCSPFIPLTASTIKTKGRYHVNSETLHVRWLSDKKDIKKTEKPSNTITVKLKTGNASFSYV